MRQTAPRQSPRTATALLVCLLLAFAALASPDAGAQDIGGAIAFVEVNVVPMDSERVLMRHTVVVEGDRIVAIGPSDEQPIAEGAQVIEARGKYLIPGLVDVHSHLLSDSRIADEFADEELAVIVANGVTTIRNPIGKPRHLVYRERIETGDLLGPTLYVASPQLIAQGADRVINGRFVETPRQAAAAVREFNQAGYDFVKLTFGITPELYEAIILTARPLRLPVIGHVGPAIGLHSALDAGQQIEHLDQYLEAISRDDSPAPAGVSGDGVWAAANWESLDHIDEGRIKEVVRATVDADVWNTPTLAALNSSFGSGRSDAEIRESPDYAFVSSSVREDLLSPRQRFWSDPPAEDRRRRYVELRNRITRDIYRAGGKLMAGSDSPEWLLLYGFTLHRELEALVDAGLPPYAALWAATRSPAVFLSSRTSIRAEFATVDETGTIRFASARTGEVDFGSIAIGKRADLVLLGANPLDDIGNTRRVEGVVLRGRWLARQQLDEMLAQSAAVLSQAPLLDNY